MDLKCFLIAAIASIFLVCGSGAVQAGRYDVLEENIKIAQVRFSEAKERLRIVAGPLFDVFVRASDIHERHKAEREIKVKYPTLYGNYILASMELDDAEYALFVAKMND